MSTEVRNEVEFPSVGTALPGPASARLMGRNDAVMYGPYRGHCTSSARPTG
jgi:hypothetical protein